MFHIKAFFEEINFYKRQNKRLKKEDNLRKKNGLQPLHEQTIQQNNERIDKLYSEITDIIYP